MRAYIGGTFDIIHPGHIELLQWAKTTFGELVVSLNRDEFVARYKGRPTSQTLAERYAIVRAIRYVDFTMVNDGDEDSRPSILSSQAQVVVAGVDWSDMPRYHAQLGLDQEWLDVHGIHIAICPLERISSSTEVKARISGN